MKYDRIDVQMVCPGPVVSNISQNALSSQLDKVCVLILNEFGILIAIYNTHVQPIPDMEIAMHRMNTERCAKLMVIGMANRLRELWIAPGYVILFLYLSQYFPNTYKL